MARRQLRPRSLEKYTQIGVPAPTDPRKNELERLRLELIEQLRELVLRRPQRRFLESFEKLLEYFTLAQSIGQLHESRALRNLDFPGAVCRDRRFANEKCCRPKLTE